MPRPSFRTLACAALLAPSVHARFNDKWFSLEPAPELLSAAAPLSSPRTETHFAWTDLDQDGDTDLVVARREPFMITGKRSNVLLLNSGGALVEATPRLPGSPTSRATRVS